jgi:hypothetical protein
MILVEPPDSGRDACEKGGAMKIGVLLADAFQDSEYFLPKFAIESTGAQTEVISLGYTRLPVFDEYPQYLSCLPRPRRVQTRNGVDTSAVPE